MELHVWQGAQLHFSWKKKKKKTASDKLCQADTPEIKATFKDAESIWVFLS